MHVERRRQRSNFKNEALAHWLTAVARRNQLAGLLVADHKGLLIESTMRGSESEEIAAWTPLLAHPNREGADRPMKLSAPMRVSEMTIDDMPLYLCAVGSESTPSYESLAQAAQGAQRILAHR